MKINKVSANKGTFKEVIFDGLFNVVLAEKDENSTEKDSRNGLGKTLLVEIINYCLGSNIAGTLKKEEMLGWSFSLECEINDSIFIFTRSTEEPNHIHIQGSIEELYLSPSVDGLTKFHVDLVKSALGKAIFGLSPSTAKSENAPSYRTLMSYFIRTDKTAFNEPFAYFAQQQTWSKQVNNAYLLGLDWELASKLHAIKSELDDLGDINKAIESGVLNDFGGTIGELETEKITLESRLEKTESRLRDFKVHEQYHEIQEKADELTSKIHKILNDINLNMQITNKYAQDLNQEDGDNLRIEEIYKGVGISFSNELQKSLEDVKNFHADVIKNRKDYLEEEVGKLTRKIEGDRAKVKELTADKAQYMMILSSHGALEEFSLLQGDANEQKAKVEDVKSKIARLTEVEDKISKLSVELEELVVVMRRDYSERLPNVSVAIQLFNENSEYLYAQPGKLTIDVTKNGFKFKVDIKRSDSDGVGSMKVFCYDLMLAEFWSSVKARPMMIVHDSKIFDGVDERQIAKAFELAYAKSKEFGFQYICTINSDSVPYDLFSDEFKETFKSSVKVRYNDKDESGTLLGISF